MQTGEVCSTCQACRQVSSARCNRAFSFSYQKRAFWVSHWMDGLQEVNSVEAIKSAVEANLGAAFVSAAAVAKEKELGNLAVLRIQDVPLSRTLQVVTDPARYCR